MQRILKLWWHCILFTIVSVVPNIVSKGSKEIWKHLELNENENTTHQTIINTFKMKKEKINKMKKEMKKINNLISYFKKPIKEGQNKSKSGRKKKIIQIKIEINEIEIRKQQKKSQWTNSLFFGEKISKIDIPLARLTK